MPNVDNGNEAIKGSRKSHRIIIVSVIAVALVVIGVLGAVIVILLNREPEVALPAPPIVYERNPGAKGTIVTEENLDEIREEMSKPVEDAYYKVSMSVEWIYETATAPARRAYVRNSEDNNRTVFFDVILADTQEIVYTSPYMPVGTEISNFALDTEVEAGEHRAIVTYYLVDDDYNIITDLSVYIDLTIERN